MDASIMLVLLSLPRTLEAEVEAFMAAAFVTELDANVGSGSLCRYLRACTRA
jgi:hypothetical protein